MTRSGSPDGGSEPLAHTDRRPCQRCFVLEIPHCDRGHSHRPIKKSSCTACDKAHKSCAAVDAMPVFRTRIGQLLDLSITELQALIIDMQPTCDDAAATSQLRRLQDFRDINNLHPPAEPQQGNFSDRPSLALHPVDNIGADAATAGKSHVETQPPALRVSSNEATPADAVSLGDKQKRWRDAAILISDRLEELQQYLV